MIGNDKKGDFMNDITQGYQPLPQDKWGCDITPTEEADKDGKKKHQIRPKTMKKTSKTTRNGQETTKSGKNNKKYKKMSPLQKQCIFLSIQGPVGHS